MMGYIYTMVVIAMYLVWSPGVHSEIEKDSGVCGKTKGCYFKPTDCDPEKAGDCSAFSSWSVTADNSSLLINMWSNTANSSYVAMGFSKSGEMMDSDVYACTSDMQVLRSRNAKTENTNSPADLVGVTESKFMINEGILSCSFRRELENSNYGDTFFNLNCPNKYTPILAWGGKFDENRIFQHPGKQRGHGHGEIYFGCSGGNGLHPSAVSFMLLCCFLLAFFQ